MKCEPAFFSNARLSNSVWLKERWNFWFFRNGRRPGICWRDWGTTNTWCEGNCYNAGFGNVRSHSGLHVSLLWTALRVWKWLSKQWTPYVGRRFLFIALVIALDTCSANGRFAGLFLGACLFVSLTHTHTHTHTHFISQREDNVAVNLNTV